MRFWYRHTEARWRNWKEDFFISQKEKQKGDWEWQHEKERWRVKARYWQTPLFNRASQIQTQSWPLIGRSQLGLGTGGCDSCLEMMEAPEKGERDNNPELLWNSVVPVHFPCAARNDADWKTRDCNKSAERNKAHSNRQGSFWGWI